MEAVSATANVVAIVGLLGESCKFIISFLRAVSDAPEDIRSHNITLRALYTAFQRVHTLCAHDAPILKFSHDFSNCLGEWMVDFKNIEAKFHSAEQQCRKGKRARTWARMRWSLSSEHWLGKFFVRVQQYHHVISLELMLLLTDLHLNSSRTWSAFESSEFFQQLTAPNASNALSPNNVPHTQSTTLAREENYPTNGVTRLQLMVSAQEYTQKAQINSSRAQYDMSPINRDTRSPIKSANSRRFLEPHSIKTERALLYKTGFISLALRYGPLVMRHFSREIEEIYEVTSTYQRGFNIAIKLPWYLSREMVLTAFAWQAVNQFQGLSFQLNIAFPKVVPNSAPIMKLALIGDFFGMEKLFSAGEASPVDVRSDGISLLHIAVQANNFELVKYFLNKGLNANVADDEGETALHLAIGQSGDYNISRLLIEKGGDLNTCNIYGSSPLHTFFNETMRKVIVRHGEGLETNTQNGRNRLILHYLAWSNRSTVEDTKLFLSNPAYLTIRDDQGRIPLHYAALRGNVEIAQHFLARMLHHAKNQTDSNGKTAFHYAVESRRTEMLHILEQEGLSVHQKNLARRGVLHEAARCDNLDAVKEVIAMVGEQELEAEDINSRTPFHLAEDYDARHVMEYLQAAYGLQPGDTKDALTSSSSSGKYLDASSTERIKTGLKWMKSNFVQIGVALLSVAITYLFATCVATRRLFSDEELLAM